MCTIFRKGQNLGTIPYMFVINQMIRSSNLYGQ